MIIRVRGFSPYGICGPCAAWLGGVGRARKFFRRRRRRRRRRRPPAGCRQCCQKAQPPRICPGGTAGQPKMSHI